MKRNDGHLDGRHCKDEKKKLYKGHKTRGAGNSRRMLEAE